VPDRREVLLIFWLGPIKIEWSSVREENRDFGSRSREFIDGRKRVYQALKRKKTILTVTLDAVGPLLESARDS